MSKRQTNIQKIKSYLIKNKKELIYSVGITLIFFGVFYRINYTTDTYFDIKGSFSDVSTNFLKAGRFITFALYVLYKIGLNFRIVYLISFILAIIAISLSIFILGKYLQREYMDKQKILPFVLSTVLVINPFTIELLFYLEKGVMASAILFGILSALSFHQYTRQKSKRTLFISFIFVLLSCFSYQGVVGLYVILSAALILLDKNKNKKHITDLLLCIFIYLSTIVLNLLLAKIIIGSTKSSTLGANFLATLEVLANGISRMLNYYEIIPSIIVYLILVLICISYIQRAKSDEIKHFSIKLVGLVVLIIGFSILPYLSQSPENIWFVPRSSWPFAAGISIVAIFICGQKEAKKSTLNIAMASCCALLFLEFFSFNQIIIDHYQTNDLDREILTQVGERITEYEDTNDVEITKVAVIRDDNISYIYPNKKIVGDAQVMAMATNWSDVNALNYYTNRNLGAVEVSEENYSCPDIYKASLDISFIGQDTVVICKH